MNSTENNLGRNIETIKLAAQLSQARNELNNIRKTLHSVRAQHKGDVERLEDLLESAKSLKIRSFNKNNEKSPTEDEKCRTKNSETGVNLTFYNVKPIGIIKSVHRQKNGTPRQGMVSSLSRAKLQIQKDIYNNPSHSLEGLNDYSHIWLIYIFHQNTSDGVHAKIAPPRLDGTKLGVFSTRSPHRPNPIGLTLAKLDMIEDDTLFVSGIDLIDETPVIDIKPYIPHYDSPLSHITAATNLDATNSQDKKLTKEEESSERLNEECRTKPLALNTQTTHTCTSNSDQRTSEGTRNETQYTGTLYLDHPISNEVSLPQWIKAILLGLEVIFNPIAEEQIAKFSKDAQEPRYRLEYLQSSQELKEAIASVLSEDPRSTYRRQKCPDRLYYFMVDCAHITTCFFGSVVEVLRVSPPDKETPSFKLV